VPPNFRRYLPLVLIAVFVLILLPGLRKKHTSGPSAGTRATATIEAMNLVDKGERAYLAAHGRFTPHLADLVAATPRLGADLALGLGVQLDVSTGGKTFVAQVTSDVLSLVRARNGDRVIAQRCLVLKSGSGVDCPKTVKPSAT
jgi:hypothetical protein